MINDSLVSVVVALICSITIICHMIEKGLAEQEARRAEDEWNWEHNSYKKF